MDYLVGKLIRETARFLQICQEQAFNDKISVKEYVAFTATKFKFIEDVLENEKRNLFIDKDFRKQLDKLFKEDFFLRESNKKIVGK